MSKNKEFERFVITAISPRIVDSWGMVKEEARLGLVGEVGELMEMYKKMLRDGRQYTDEEFAGEIGDIQHYLVRIMLSHGFTLDNIIDFNMEKIKRRNNV